MEKIIKIFISYTLRDKEIDYDLLNQLKKFLWRINTINSFIDILDNNNTTDPQSEVFSQLSSSDVIWIIQTPQIKSSPWAMREYEFAEKAKKPIFYLSVLNVVIIIKMQIKYLTL